MGSVRDWTLDQRGSVGRHLSARNEKRKTHATVLHSKPLHRLHYKLFFGFDGGAGMMHHTPGLL